MARGSICIFVAASLVAGSPAGAAQQKLFALTPEHFAVKVRTKDDALETKASFDTREGWREQPSDVFLRAYVDKQTGEVEYQLYASVSTRGDWQFYDRINYQAPDRTVQEGKLIRVGSDVSCGAVRYGGRCTVYEDGIFIVDESLLRTLAGLYAPGREVAWQFKLKGRYQDGDYLNGIAPAEAAGLLAVVDRYRSARGLTSGQKPAVPAAPAAPAADAAQPTPPPAIPGPDTKPTPPKKKPVVTCVTCN